MVPDTLCVPLDRTGRQGRTWPAHSPWTAERGVSTLMDDREKWLKESVMNAIADDYEDFDMVCLEVSKWAKERSLIVEQQEIANMLQRVIEEGYADAFMYSPELQRYEVTSFPSGEVSDLWFYMSAKGKRFLERE